MMKMKGAKKKKKMAFNEEKDIFDVFGAGSKARSDAMNDIGFQELEKTAEYHET